MRDLLGRISPWLCDVLAVVILFYLLFLHIPGDLWLRLVRTPPEYEIFSRASLYVGQLWQRLFEVSSLPEFGRWLTGFVFHLSPVEMAEKPIYSFVLGYFRILFSGALPEIGLLPESALNIAALSLSGLLLVRMAHLCLGRVHLISYVFIVAIFTNFVVLIEALRGYHTYLGLFFFMLAAYLAVHWQQSGRLFDGGRRLFAVGFVLSLSFFSSHHLFPQIGLAWLGLAALAAISGGSFDFKAGWRVAGRVGLGFGTLFLYYFLRDSAFNLHLLDSFRDPELAEYLDQYLQNDTRVLPALFGSSGQALAQNLPRDLRFFFDLIADLNGKPVFILTCLAAMTGVPLGTKNLRSNNQGARRLSWLYFMVATALCAGVALLAGAPLPYVSRAWVPVLFLFFATATIALVLMAELGGYLRWLSFGFAGVLSLAMFSSYAGYLDPQLRTSAERHLEGADILANLKSETDVERQYSMPASEVLAKLKASGAFENHKFVLRPLVDVSGNGFNFAAALYCFIAVLQKNGLKPVEVLDGRKDFTRVEFVFAREHTYFQLGRRLATSPWPDYAKVNVFLAGIFDPMSYYIYSWEEILDRGRRLKNDSVTCKSLAWDQK